MSAYRSAISIFVLLCALLCAPTLAFAVPSGEVIERYTRAREALSDNPELAYELASGLPKLRDADDARLDLLAEAAIRTQRVDEAINVLERLADETPSTTEAFRTRLEQAELLLFAGRVKPAVALLKRLKRDKKKVQARRADRTYLFSRLLRLDHDLELAAHGGPTRRAKSLARDLLVTHPTQAATQRPGLAVRVDELSDASRYSRAHNLMNAWGYHEARAEFTRLADHPKYGERSRWELGIIGLRKLRDQPVESERIFRGFLDNPKRKEEAQWYLARSLMRQERYDEALGVFADIRTDFPRGKYLNSSYYYTGWLPYDHRDNDEAIQGLQRYVDKYGRRSSKSSYIYGFLAWAYMREGRWKEAIDTWDSMMPFGNTVVAGKALYWKAYAQHELGEKAAAIETLQELRDRYPLSYYGMLGEQLRARFEGRSERASEVWWPEGGGKLDDTPRVDVTKYRFRSLPKPIREEWERVKTLASLGEQHLAREALKPIQDRLVATVDDEKRQEFIHALGWFVGDYNTMWKVTAGSISALPGQPDPTDLKSAMAYPRAYKDIVDGVAEEFALPPHLIWAIMRQESRYKPGAVSYTDAVGALQMIPKTAKKVARDLGTTYDIRTFFRPEIGFRFSGYYMRKLLDTFDGLYVPMAASYNSGPQVVARWFGRNPDASFPWLIEEFEYNEGRAYCRKVAEHMLRYLYLYEADEARRKEVVDKMFPLSRDIEIPDDVGY